MNVINQMPTCITSLAKDNNTCSTSTTTTQTHNSTGTIIAGTTTTSGSNDVSPIVEGACSTESTCADNKILTGVIVNGFHPQLHLWKENNRRIANSRNNSNSHKRSRADSSLEEKIQEKVSRVRTDSVRDVCEIQEAREERIQIMSSQSQSLVGITKEQSILKLYSEMFENSNVPQIITAPGGRIAAWNSEFTNTCGLVQDKNQSPQSLTAFDIVEPSMIPKLYEIFLMALTLDRNQDEEQQQQGTDSDNNDNEEEDVTYPSLTVPCVNFGDSEESYYITFSLMHDKEPEKRCFHCILSTSPRAKLGEIYSISQKFLMEML